MLGCMPRAKGDEERPDRSRKAVLGPEPNPDHTGNSPASRCWYGVNREFLFSITTDLKFECDLLLQITTLS